jgi:hypothetical protein
MSEWFGKKSPEPETSPGGSIIHRYKNSEWLASRIGFTDESSAKFAEARNQVYARLFGKVHGVFREALPLLPRVEVHTYYRVGKDVRDVCTLVTSGMSDLEMNVPVGTKAPRRVELIFYCSEPKQEYRETMQWLAHFPHDQRTWIGSGHTIPNGNPPAPLFGSSVLDTVLFIPTIVKRDGTLPEELILDGEPVHFLWVVPLTTPECELKLAKGLNAILALFGQNRHPHVFDPSRASYV